MTRSLHRWFGLIASVLLTVVALSGAALSIFPAAEALTTPAAQHISVAELAARVQRQNLRWNRSDARRPGGSPPITTKATNPPPLSSTLPLARRPAAPKSRIWSAG